VLFRPNFVCKLMYVEDNEKIASESVCSFLLLALFINFLKKFNWK
jgi:hypothetical protein